MRGEGERWGDAGALGAKMGPLSRNTTEHGLLSQANAQGWRRAREKKRRKAAFEQQEKKGGCR